VTYIVYMSTFRIIDDRRDGRLSNICFSWFPELLRHVRASPLLRWTFSNLLFCSLNWPANWNYFETFRKFKLVDTTDHVEVNIRTVSGEYSLWSRTDLETSTSCPGKFLRNILATSHIYEQRVFLPSTFWILNNFKLFLKMGSVFMCFHWFITVYFFLQNVFRRSLVGLWLKPGRSS